MKGALTFDELSSVQRLAVKRQCEESFIYFAKTFFAFIYSEKMLVNWHHIYLCDYVEKLVSGELGDKSLAITIPPGGTKTFLVSVAFPCWLMVQVRTGRISKFRNLNVSFSADLVIQNSRLAMDIINSREFRSFWPCDFSLAQSREFIIREGDSLKAHVISRPIFGQVTGSRAGFVGNEDGQGGFEFTGALIIDDPMKANDAFSQVKRDNVNNAMTNTLRSRRANKTASNPTPFIIIMQRLHAEDAAFQAISGAMGVDFLEIKIPLAMSREYINELPTKYKELALSTIEGQDSVVIDDIEVFSYWPGNEDIHSIKKLSEVDPYTFYSQGQQEPIKTHGTLLDTAWFPTYEVLPKLRYRAIYVDTNSGRKEDHLDYTVFTHIGVSEDYKIYVIDIVRGKWTPAELQVQAERCWKKWKKHGKDTGYLTKMQIENKAAGSGLIADLRLRTKEGIVVIPEDRSVGKCIRYNNTQPRFVVGDVRIPATQGEDGRRIEHVRYFNGDIAASTQFVPALLHELADCTWETLENKRSNSYDDQLDTLMSCVEQELIVGRKLDWVDGGNHAQPRLMS